MLAKTDQLTLPALPDALTAAETRVAELCAVKADNEDRLYILTDAANATELGAALTRQAHALEFV
jgi:hypothetical protein